MSKQLNALGYLEGYMQKEAMPGGKMLSAAAGKGKEWILKALAGGKDYVSTMRGANVKAVDSALKTDVQSMRAAAAASLRKGRAEHSRLLATEGQNTAKKIVDTADRWNTAEKKGLNVLKDSRHPDDRAAAGRTLQDIRNTREEMLGKIRAQSAKKQEFIKGSKKVYQDEVRGKLQQDVAARGAKASEARAAEQAKTKKYRTRTAGTAAGFAGGIVGKKVYDRVADKSEENA